MSGLLANNQTMNELVTGRSVSMLQRRNQLGDHTHHKSNQPPTSRHSWRRLSCKKSTEDLLKLGTGHQQVETVIAIRILIIGYIGHQMSNLFSMRRQRFTRIQIPNAVIRSLLQAISLMTPCGCIAFSKYKISKIFPYLT